MNKWILTKNNELVNLRNIIKFYISDKTYSIYAITGQKNEEGRNISIKICSVIGDKDDVAPEDPVLLAKCGNIMKSITDFLDSTKVLLDMNE